MWECLCMCVIKLTVRHNIPSPSHFLCCRQLIQSTVIYIATMIHTCDNTFVNSIQQLYTTPISCTTNCMPLTIHITIHTSWLLMNQAKMEAVLVSHCENYNDTDVTWSVMLFCQLYWRHTPDDKLAHHWIHTCTLWAHSTNADTCCSHVDQT